ncbi:MAG: crosslink repair DNA glycosylase YcaQ family protein [bacterium]
MGTIEVSKQLARKIILYTQLLDGKTKLPKGKKGAAEAIKKLGYIQIDTLAVVNRSHHHTLWTRRKDYSENMLHDLQAKDRMVFEYWGHAMSYFHMDDFRFFLPKMNNFKNPQHRWVKQHLEKSGNLLDPILERIKIEGPLGSKNFEKPDGIKQGSWWDWKPAKMALELLFWRGDLMISGRKNFQKVYDLTERVLPKGINLTVPTNNEISDFLVHRALTALGIAEEKEMNKFMQPSAQRDADWMFADKENISKSLKRFVESGEVVQVKIHEGNHTDHFVLKKTLEFCSKSKYTSPEIFLLSPFDNLIIQRERTRKFFDFNYSIECYLPTAKRKYGYFVMPILWGDKFVGRLDPKADRTTKVLIVKNLVLEPGFNNFEDFLPKFANKLLEFSKFNDCNEIKFIDCSPKKIMTKLKQDLKGKSD